MNLESSGSRDVVLSSIEFGNGQLGLDVGESLTEGVVDGLELLAAVRRGTVIQSAECSQYNFLEG